MTDQVSKIEEEKTKIKKIIDHLSEHHWKWSYAIIILLVTYGFGFYEGTRKCSGMGEIEKRQLAGTLTKKEQEIEAANLKIGKVQTDLQTSENIKEKLAQDNAALSTTANNWAKQYKLVVDQYSSLKASFDTVVKGGKTGSASPEIVTSNNPTCGACKGQIDFGTPTFATCGWTNYSGIETSNGGSVLKLKLGVRLQSVSLKQQPKDGSLRAEIGRVYLTDTAGNVITEGTMNEDSRVFTAPSLLGDQNRRHFYLYGGASQSYGSLGLYTQRGVNPFIYGFQVNRDWKTKELQPGMFIGFQLR